MSPLQLPRPLRHTLNIRAHGCQLPLAGLGHSCGDLTRQAGAKFRLPRGRAAGAGRDHGVQWEEGIKEAGVTWVVAIPLVLTEPARGLFTPFGKT